MVLTMRARRVGIGKPALYREHVAEHVALVADEREIDEAQVQAGIASAAARVVPQQPRAMVLGQVVLERIEQVVEVMVRHLGRGEAVASLDVVPERIGVEHVARTRHDVRPVAGLVLLQQPEVLVLLRAAASSIARLTSWPQREPPTRPCRRTWSTAISHHKVASMQPRYQKSASCALRIDVLRDLPVVGLLCRQRVEARHRGLLERGMPLPHIAITQMAASRPKMRV